MQGKLVKIVILII